MLIQFRISEKDETLTNLIEKLEKEGKDRRGYVSNRLRDMLKAYTILSDFTGETDPYKLMMKLASRSGVEEKKEEVEEIIEEVETKSIDADFWLAQFEAFDR
jgi:hypothetical protein